MSVTKREPYTIGASSVPAILGLDPWDSAYALGARLLDGRDNPASEAAQMGLDLEAAHAELVAAAGYDVMPAPVAGFVHPDLPWLCVHPDGLVVLPGRLGASASSSGNHGATPTVTHRGEARIAQERAMLSQKPGTAAETAAGASAAPAACIGPLELKLRGVAPSEAITMRDTVQSLVQVHAMGATQGLVSVLHGGFGGVRRDEWTTDADAGLFALVAERCEAFLSGLRRGKLPAPDGRDSTRDAIRERFAHADAGKAVRASQECWGWVRRTRELREVVKTAKAQQAVYDQKIQDAMGDATELISPYDTLAATWREGERTTLDVTALKRDRPEIAGEYAKTTTSRRFEANP